MSGFTKTKLLSTYLDNDEISIDNIQNAACILYKDDPLTLIQDRKFIIKLPYCRREELYKVHYCFIRNAVNILIDVFGGNNIPDDIHDFTFYETVRELIIPSIGRIILEFNNDNSPIELIRCNYIP